VRTKIISYFCGCSGLLPISPGDHAQPWRRSAPGSYATREPSGEIAGSPADANPHDRIQRTIGGLPMDQRLAINYKFVTGVAVPILVALSNPENGRHLYRTVTIPTGGSGPVVDHP
jgi:hypothetical protein